MLYRLIYISDSLIDASSAEVKKIAQRSEAYNAQRGLTGYLYFDRAHFLQVLEGLEPDVQQLFEEIAADRRHLNVNCFQRGPTEHRLFGGWAMGRFDGSRMGEPGQNLLTPLLGGKATGEVGAADAPALIHFLCDLSVGREGVYPIGGTAA